MAFRVIDADTVQDETTGEKFRLAGVNAPEASTPEGAALKADPALPARLDASIPVRAGQDYYGRTVARFVPTAGGPDVNQQLVTEGKVGAVDYSGGGQQYAEPRSTTHVPQDQMQRLGYRPLRDTPGDAPKKDAPRTNLQELGARFSSGVDSLQSGLYGTLSAAGNLLARDTDAQGRPYEPRAEKDDSKLTLRDRATNWMQRVGETGYMRNQQQAQANAPSETLEDVLEGRGDALRYAFGVMGEALPSTLAMLGLGAAAAATGGGAAAGFAALAGRGALGAAARQVAIRAGERQLVNALRKKTLERAALGALPAATPLEAQIAARRVVANLPDWAARSAKLREVTGSGLAGNVGKAAAKNAARAGAFTASTGMQAGQFYEETKNDYGVAAPGGALALGAAAGALDVLGLEMVVKHLLPKGSDVAAATGIAKRVLAGAGVGVATEAPTEALQEVLGVYHKELNNPDQSTPIEERMLAPQYRMRYLEAAVAGGLFGGLFGGTGGGMSGAVEALRRRPEVAPSAAEPSAINPPEEIAPTATEQTPASLPEPPPAAPASGAPLEGETQGVAPPAIPASEVRAPTETQPPASPEAERQSPPASPAAPEAPTAPAPQVAPAEVPQARPAALALPPRPSARPSSVVSAAPPEPGTGPSALETGLPQLRTEQTENSATHTPLPQPPASAKKTEGGTRPSARAAKVETPAAQGGNVPSQAPVSDVRGGQDTIRLRRGESIVLAPDGAKKNAPAVATPAPQPQPETTDEKVQGKQRQAEAEAAPLLSGEQPVGATPSAGAASPTRESRLGEVFATPKAAQEVRQTLARLGVDAAVARNAAGQFGLRDATTAKVGATRSETLAEANSVDGRTLDNLRAGTERFGGVDGLRAAFERAASDPATPTYETRIDAENAAVKRQLKPGEYWVGKKGAQFALASLTDSAADTVAKPAAPSAKPAARQAVRTTPPGKEGWYDPANLRIVDGITTYGDPNEVYVFGDNLARAGRGRAAGQAVIRDAVNAVGIPTKVSPTRYATDDHPAMRGAIDAAIQRLVKLRDEGKTLVFPGDGLGTGRAKLADKAPALARYLQEQLVKHGLAKGSETPSAAPASRDAGGGKAPATAIAAIKQPRAAKATQLIGAGETTSSTAAPKPIKVPPRFAHQPIYDTALFDLYGAKGFDRVSEESRKAMERLLTDVPTPLQTILDGVKNIFIITRPEKAGGVWGYRHGALGIADVANTPRGTAAWESARKTLAHELGHVVDHGDGTGHDHYFSREHASYALPVGALAKVEADGTMRFVPGAVGELMEEMVRLYEKSRKLGANHKLNNVLKVRYKLEDLEANLKARDEAALSLVQSETFAQAHAAYWVLPELFKTLAPKNHAFFEALYATPDGTALSLADVSGRLQRALRTQSEIQRRDAIRPELEGGRGVDENRQAGGEIRPAGAGIAGGRTEPAHVATADDLLAEQLQHMQTMKAQFVERMTMEQGEDWREYIAAHPQSAGAKEWARINGIFAALMDGISDADAPRLAVSIREFGGGYAAYRGETRIMEPGTYNDAELAVRLNPELKGLPRVTTPMFGAPLDGNDALGKVAARMREAGPADAIDDTLAAVASDPRLASLLGQFFKLLDKGWPPARTHAAIGALYEDRTADADTLRALTAWAYPTDLPVVEHFARVQRLLDDYRRAERETPLHNLEQKVPPEPAETPATVSELLAAENRLGAGAELADAQPVVHSLVLHRAKYLTATHGELRLAQMRRAKDSVTRTPSQDVLTPLDRALHALSTIAEASEHRRATAPLGPVEAWLERINDPQSTVSLGELGDALFARIVAHNAARKEATGTGKKILERTPEGRLREALRRLRGMHDAAGMPLGDLVLEFNARTDSYELRERITTLDSDVLPVFAHPRTGVMTTMGEYVREYIAEKRRAWRRADPATGAETPFWRAHGVTLKALDGPGSDMAAAPAVPFRAKDITRLGYLSMEAQKLPAPASDYDAFNAGLSALMLHADKMYVLEPGQDLTNKIISRYNADAQTYGFYQRRQAAASAAQELERRAVSIERDATEAVEALRGKRPPQREELAALMKRALRLLADEAAVAPAENRPRLLSSLERLRARADGVVDARNPAASALALNGFMASSIRPALRRLTAGADAVSSQGRPPTPLTELEGVRAGMYEEAVQELEFREGVRKMGVDTGGTTAQASLAETKQAQDTARWEESRARSASTTARIGATSERAIGAGALPEVKAGVSRHEGSAAHWLVSQALERLQLKHTRVELYNSDDLTLLEDELWKTSPSAYQMFAKRIRAGSLPDAAVAFVDGRILLYFNKALKGEALAHALSHELGHVVYRALLDSERRKNSAIWNRIMDDFQSKPRKEGFMEWFADEVAAWNRAKQAPDSAVKQFWKRVVDAAKNTLRALGLPVAPGSVSAYLDGLVLREKEREYKAYLDAARGVAGYDLLTLQTTYHGSAGEERLVMDRHEVDFLDAQGAARKTVDQVRSWIDAHAQLKHVAEAAGGAWKWADDVLSSSNGWLRSQGIEELRLKADMLDRGAREAVIELSTDADIDALADTSDNWKGMSPTAIRMVKDRAAVWRSRPGVLGVKLVRYIDADGSRRAEAVPVWSESFSHALQRLDKGVWGAGPNGYYDLLKEVNTLGTPEELHKLGESLLRGAPDTLIAKKVDRWIKRFFNAYVKPGFVGAYSGQTHIGDLKNWGLARYYSPEKVEANKEAFIELLMTDDDTTGYRGMSRRAADLMAYRIASGGELITTEGETASGLDAGLPPSAPSAKNRKLDIGIEKLLPFLETDITKVLPRYVHSMIRRVEWEKRFSDELLRRGKDGKDTWQWRPNHFAEVVRQAAVFNHPDLLDPKRGAYVLKKVKDIDEAYLGRFGASQVDPRVRTGMSLVQSGMSWLTLPFAVLSNFTDLAGPIIRTSGDTKAAWKGLKDAFRAMRKHDALWDAAEASAVIFRETRDTFAASMFDSPWLTETAQKMNDALFRWNGMQKFTTFSRLASWATSKHWLRSLAEGKHPDSARWLKDLGLTKADLDQWVEAGMPEFTEYRNEAGYDSPAFRIMLARRRFVDESAFAPGPGQRPLFASHPYAMLVWHLKQFAWSYYTQLLKPAMREVIKNPRATGKVAAVLPFALLFPLAMAGMGLRDELRYGLWREGEAPKRDEDIDSKFGRILGRTGLLGPLQLLIDADTQQTWGRSFIFSLLGPTAGKIDEAMRAKSAWDTAGVFAPGVAVLPAERKALGEWVDGLF